MEQVPEVKFMSQVQRNKEVKVNLMDPDLQFLQVEESLTHMRRVSGRQSQFLSPLSSPSLPPVLPSIDFMIIVCCLVDSKVLPSVTEIVSVV